ncbi:MAG: hypothetical protein RBS07_03075 [Lentimicrobium sp.]|jgi:hypothetical protein|nr:hypothetical protein [Lentimicrobium sp.]
MKTTNRLFFAAILLMFIAFSCENENEKEKPGFISGRITDHTGCKVLKSDESINLMDSYSCAEYSFNGITKKLSIKHINAGFNCCPGTLSANITLTNDTIIIQEFESEQSCNCNCLFDLDIEIDGIEPKPYQIIFIEPYCANQHPLIFKVDFANQAEGECCVTRNNYPWG